MHADVGTTVGVLGGHLGVYDASSCRHELEVASVNGAFVSSKVFVVDGAAEEVCDCFLAAVGVVWEACARSDGEVVLWGHVSRLTVLQNINEATYEHEEGSEVLQLSCANRSSDSCACSFGLIDRLKHFADLARSGSRGSQGGVIGRDDWETLEC